MQPLSRIRSFYLVSAGLSSLALIILLSVLLIPVAAQPIPPAIDPTPFAYTPGVPLIELTATLPASGCFVPLNLSVGQPVLLKVGTELRNLPTLSGGIVWDTVFDNRVDPDGDDGEFDFVLAEDPVLIEAVIIEGPVCADNLNWWRVAGTGNPGWVAEGTPEFYTLFAAPTSADNCAPLYALKIGDTPDLLYNVRIRTQPHRGSITRTVVPAGTPLIIVDGPSCDGEYLWWVVQATVSGVLYEGWMREGAAGDTYLLPTDLPSLADGTLCANPQSYNIGVRGFVRYNDGIPKSLRVAPNDAAPLIATLVNNVGFVFEGGPVCANNLNWWFVRIQGREDVVGWVAEGSPGVGYWLRESNPYEFAAPFTPNPDIESNVNNFPTPDNPPVVTSAP
ncbi:MAG: hypothetical protein ACPG7F_08535 [Aggregatilineales bacterium]